MTKNHDESAPADPWLLATKPALVKALGISRSHWWETITKTPPRCIQLPSEGPYDIATHYAAGLEAGAPLATPAECFPHILAPTQVAPSAERLRGLVGEYMTRVEPFVFLAAAHLEQPNQHNNGAARVLDALSLINLWYSFAFWAALTPAERRQLPSAVVAEKVEWFGEEVAFAAGPAPEGAEHG